MYRILIVDDNEENRKLLEEILRKIAICDFAVTGKEAIEFYHKSLGTSHRYGLILLDIELPGVSGLTILENIRKTENESGIPLGEGIPIIIVTVHEKKFSEAYDKGCDDYILKPINANILLKKINNILRNHN